MPHNSSQWINHTFGGGWATDYGKTFYGGPQNGTLSLPWLNKAENIQYTLDGRIQKAPGTRRFARMSDLFGGTNIRGLYDYTKTGTTGSASTQIIIACGSDYFKFENAVLERISSPYGSGLVIDNEEVQFSVFNDLLIIANSGGGTPYSWDQTTFQALAGSPPLFSFSIPHRGRHWAAGIEGVPHRLYYSAFGNPEDWIGAGSGSIDIDPGDGSSIVGLWSWKEDLWVFKGSSKLSIHRISGSTPSDFVRSNFTTGISAAGQRSIFAYGDDILFWNPHGSLHSLKTTSNYGDYVQSYMNYPILSWCKQNMNTGNIWQAGVFPLAGYSLISFRSPAWPSDPTYTISNNMTMLVDFRFTQQEQYPRFALWPYLQCHALAYAKNSISQPSFISGDVYGHVFDIDASNGANDNGLLYTHRNNGIAPRVESPYLTYGPPTETKTLVHVAINLAPDEHFTNTLTLSWGSEKGFGQSMQISKQFGVPLDTFVLNTDSLGTYAADTLSVEPMYGDFRSIQYTFSEISSKKMTIQNFGALYTPSGESLEA